MQAVPSQMERDSLLPKEDSTLSHEEARPGEPLRGAEPTGTAFAATWGSGAGRECRYYA